MEHRRPLTARLITLRLDRRRTKWPPETKNRRLGGLMQPHFCQGVNSLQIFYLGYRQDVAKLEGEFRPAHPWSPTQPPVRGNKAPRRLHLKPIWLTLLC